MTDSAEHAMRSGKKSATFSCYPTVAAVLVDFADEGMAIVSEVVV